MNDTLTCLAIDDDALFLRKLEAFIMEIPWLQLISMHKNPVQGATAFVKEQPDVLFMDMEMPHVDGGYLVDWLSPKVSAMTKKPVIIVISSLEDIDIQAMPNVSGYLNKFKLNEAETLAQKVKEVTGR